MAKQTAHTTQTAQTAKRTRSSSRTQTKVQMEKRMRVQPKIQTQTENMVFALDIGTRSIIGMVGIVEDERVKVLAIEREEHTERVMIDGQIEDIKKVATLADKVKKRLEDKLKCTLTRVCVAAAGRALRTKRADFELELPGTQLIDDEVISRLEAGAISKAEEAFDEENAAENISRRFYLAGYTVCQYYLDQYMMSSLKDHRGRHVKADLIVTFLPSEVVESLYTTMHKIGLEVASITLEPIAAINAAIPENLRLLNLVMVDIGAGTSDIAACTGGSVTGYTMATFAGDEITETLMKAYLVDFKTAEAMKFALNEDKDITYTDILGLEQKVSRDEVAKCVQKTVDTLCQELADRIIEINGSAPSALFLAGGGSKLSGLREGVAAALKMDQARVAIAGNNFKTNAFSDEYDLNDPEYATPLGIAVSSGLNLLNDSFRVIMNGKPAKLFRSGSFTALNLLMMNGYNYQDILGKPGYNLTITLNGQRKIFYGTAAQPATLFINKKEGKLSDVIHAGDVIDFTPAVDGKPASACLGDIDGAAASQYLTLNGTMVDLETPLKNGDVVDMIPGRQPEPVKEKEVSKEESKEDLKENLQVEVDEMRSETILENSATKVVSAEPENIDSEKVWAVQENVKKPESVRESAVEDIVTGEMAKPETKPTPPVKPEVRKRNILFYLNDARLYLPPKEDGSVYHLMDLLEYSGIDLKNPKGNVKMTVNGESAMFQQTIKEGDVVHIVEVMR